VNQQSMTSKSCVAVAGCSLGDHVAAADVDFVSSVMAIDIGLKASLTPSFIVLIDLIRLVNPEAAR